MSMQAAGAEVPVLIAGGGLVGLSTAMFLAQHGIASMAIERLRGGSPVPRAAHFHLRTLELFRLAGVEDEVRRQYEEEFLPDGARGKPARRCWKAMRSSRCGRMRPASR